VGCGLAAGILFAFSVFVMAAFDRLPAAHAIAAMQAINRTILTPLFLLVYAGSAVAAASSTALLALDDGSWAAAAGATALYVVGVLVVTGRANLPRNDALDALDPDGLARERPGAEAAWRAYRVPWTRWNHVRVVAASAACALLALAA
jgi:uncharacterized membrane protein